MKKKQIACNVCGAVAQEDLDFNFSEQLSPFINNSERATSGRTPPGKRNASSDLTTTANGDASDRKRPRYRCRHLLQMTTELDALVPIIREIKAGASDDVQRMLAIARKSSLHCQWVSPDK